MTIPAYQTFVGYKREFIANGGVSKRYHTADMLTVQDIAQHSFGVAWLCELITSGTASKALIMAALVHDLAEHKIGDVPSPVKRELNIGAALGELEAKELRDVELHTYESGLSHWEKTVLKMSDCMEGMQHCIRERMLGSRKIDIIFDRFDSYVEDLLAECNSMEYEDYTARELHVDLRRAWNEVKYGS